VDGEEGRLVELLASGPVSGGSSPLPLETTAAAGPLVSEVGAAGAVPTEDVVADSEPVAVGSATTAPAERPGDTTGSAAVIWPGSATVIVIGSIEPVGAVISTVSIGATGATSTGVERTG
jgi:hypothetical protein